MRFITAASCLVLLIGRLPVLADPSNNSSAGGSAGGASHMSSQPTSNLGRTLDGGAGGGMPGSDILRMQEGQSGRTVLDGNSLLTPDKARIQWLQEHERIERRAAAQLSAIGGGFYRAGTTDANRYWQGPSGYYYSLGALPLAAAANPSASSIWSADVSSMTPAQPPVITVIADLQQFVEDAHKRNQLDQSNYESDTMALNNIQARMIRYIGTGGGVLQTADEASLRKELSVLMTTIAYALSN